MDVTSLSVSALTQVRDSAPVKGVESTELNAQASSTLQAGKSQNPLSPPEVEASVDKLNKQLDKLGNQSLMFAVDESTQSSVVKLVDRDTGELVRQFPSGDTLKMIKNIQDYLSRSDVKSTTNSSEGLTGNLFNEII
jgi:flagellar protein FlaG